MPGLETLNEIYARNEGLLQGAELAAGDAQQDLVSAELIFASARDAEEAARNAAWHTGLMIADEIHEAADTGAGFSALDYLRAVVNARSQGRRAGDDLVEEVSPLNNAMSSSATPIAVFGSSTLNTIIFGLSGGGVQARRSGRGENGIEADTSIVMELPLRNVSGFGVYAVNSRSEAWAFHGDSRLQPTNIGIMQDLRRIRVAGSAEEVEEAIRLAAAVRLTLGSEHDGRIDGRGFVESTMFYSDMVPVIAFGEEAVIKGLKQMRAVSSVRHARRDKISANLISLDAVAAGIAIGIDPERLTAPGYGAVKMQLAERFIKSLGVFTHTLIDNEMLRRDGILSRIKRRWPVAATPEVMGYLGISPAEVTTSVRDSIGQYMTDERYRRFIDTRMTHNDASELVAEGLGLYFDLDINSSRLAVTSQN